MKKIVFIFCLIASFLVGNAQPAQNSGTPEQRAQRVLDGQSFVSLNLTADQKTKAIVILADLNRSLDALNATIPQNATDRQVLLTALQPKRMALMNDAEKQFIEVLVASQKASYATIARNRPANQGFGQQAGGRAPIPIGTMTTNPDAHDPVMAKEGDTYYLFYTNGGVSQWSSKDMVNWRREAPVFTTTPAWVPEAVPGFRGVGFWAPDIILHKGMWHLYYSASAFGKNTSAIGLTINKTLNPASPDYKWVDQGMVVKSVPGRDLWNAIDPNIAFDEKGTPWMSFGSFWNGIKLFKLSEDMKTIAQPEEWYTIAARQRDFTKVADGNAGGASAAVEGPFIFKKDNYYYLFISWDRCCAGLQSTYNIRVGRSEKITGPYLDKEGVDLAKGGGTLVLGGDVTEPKTVFALGHNSAYTFDGTDYLVFHKYVQEGSRLGIEKLGWVDGWPVIVAKSAGAGVK